MTSANLGFAPANDTHPGVFAHADKTDLKHFTLSEHGLLERLTLAGTTSRAYIPSLQRSVRLDGAPECHILTASGDGSTSHPLHLTEEDFSRLCEDWHIPHRLLGKCDRPGSDFLEYTIEEQPITPEEDASPQGLSQPTSKLLSIVFRTSSPRQSIVCVISCDLPSRLSSRCFIASKDGRQTGAILSDINNSASDVLPSPEAILAIILTKASKDIGADTGGARERSYQVAARLGILSPSLRDFLADRGYAGAPDRDYASLNVDIYDFQWSVNSIRLKHNTLSVLAQALTAMLYKYTDEVLSPVTFRYIDDVLRWLELEKAELEFLSSIIKNQSTVLFNLINQRDSRLNYSVARSSQQIAAASKRDSSAMKTISILTLVFLPGTFVSAVFSTEIFDFGEGHAGYGRVAKAWWIYMLCCLLLTALTVGVWAGWMVWRLNKSREEERREMEDLQHDDNEAAGKDRRHRGPIVVKDLYQLPWSDARPAIGGASQHVAANVTAS